MQWKERIDVIGKSLPLLNSKSLLRGSVTRFGKFLPFCTLLKVFGHFWKALFSFWQNFEYSLSNVYALGQIYSVTNGQILKNTLSIWFHCSEVKILCSGFSSVGRVVASNTRGPQFGSSHRQILCKLSLMQ